MVVGAYVVQAQELSLEPFVASIPVAILIALVLYVNEIPDRGSDAAVGKRTLPSRMRPQAVTKGFLAAALVAFAVIPGAVVFGLVPPLTLVALVPLPLAFRVYRGIQEHYDRPYDLMPAMAQNIQLHLSVGMLLFAGYAVTAVVSSLFDIPNVLS